MKRIAAIAVVICMLATLPCFAESSDAATAKPSATSITDYSITSTSFTLKWKQVSNVSGYQIQYDNNRFFFSPKSVTVSGASTVKKTVSTGSMSPCYMRIRTYKKSGDSAAVYSNWTVANNAKVSKEATISRLSKGSKEFELRDAANQKVGKYDTLQGGCAYGNTGWYILYNRKVSKCKIAKVDTSTMKVLKVSGELKVSHGSTLTYNPDQKVLVVAHGPSIYKRISIVDPSTLTVKKVVSLKLPSGTSGASKKRVRNFRGVTGIAYNQEKKIYVGKVKGYNSLVMYDSNFKAIKYVNMTEKNRQLIQSIDSFDDMVLVAQSPNKYGKYNLIKVFDWNGKYQSTIRLSKRYELETIYHNNNNLYAGYYRSYYKTYYLDGFRIRVTKGKKNKVKTKLKYSRLMRDNYLYKVTDL